MLSRASGFCDPKGVLGIAWTSAASKVMDAEKQDEMEDRRDSPDIAFDVWVTKEQER